VTNIRSEALKTRLQQYLDCETAILSGAQSYAIGSRNLTRANLREIAAMIRYLEAEIAKEEAAAAGRGRNACAGVIPRDL
jgi:hypothetical protein